MDKWNQGIVGRVGTKRKAEKHKAKPDQKKPKKYCPQVLIKRSRLVEEIIKQQFVERSRKHLTHTKDLVDIASLPKLQRTKCKITAVVKKPTSLVDIPFLPKLQFPKHKRRAVVPKPKHSVDNCHPGVLETTKPKSPDITSKSSSLVHIFSPGEPQTTKPKRPEITSKSSTLVHIFSPGEPQATKPKSPEITSKSSSLVHIYSPGEPQTTKPKSPEITSNSSSLVHISSPGEPQSTKPKSPEITSKSSTLVHISSPGEPQTTKPKTPEITSKSSSLVQISSPVEPQTTKPKSPEITSDSSSLVHISSPGEPQSTKPKSPEITSKSSSLVHISSPGEPQTTKPKSPEITSKSSSLVHISSPGEPQTTKPKNPEVTSKSSSLVHISSPGEPKTTKPKSPEITSKSSTLVHIFSPGEQQSTMTGRRQGNHESIKSFIVICGKDRNKVIVKQHSQLEESIVKEESTARTNKRISNDCNSQKVDKQHCGEAQSIEQMISNDIPPEKTLANTKTREIRHITFDSPNTTNRSDVPFSPPVIKITIGGTNRAEIRETNIQSPAKAGVSDLPSEVGPDRIKKPVATKSPVVTKSPVSHTAKPPRTKKWKRSSIENVVRITTKTPIFSSAVLGPNTLEPPCTLKKIKLGTEWKKTSLSPDKPDLCFTPDTASSGYTSECESRKTPPVFTENTAFSFEDVPEPVAVATHVSPRKSKSPIVFSPPICIAVANNIEPSKLCLDANAKRQVDFEQTSWSSTSSPQRRVMFKMPQLPNTKRPPTRIKFPHMNELSSELVDQPHLQQDDVISIFAGSEILDDDQSNLHYQPTVRSSDPFDDNNMNFPDFECEDEGALPLEEPVEPYRPENPAINDWIAKSHGHRNLQRMLSFVCRFYRQGDHCYHQTCKFMHAVPAVFDDLESLSENEFLKVLEFTVTSKTIFESKFDLILNYMSDHGRQDLILHSVSDIMRIRLNKMPYIEKVINTLKNLGFTFEKALSEILTTTGRSNESLLDILLSFAVDEDSFIVHHWDIIQKLISFRQQRLDNGVVSDMFRKCIELNPPNKNLCENMYRDLCVKSHFDLNVVDRIVVLKYIALLLHFHLNSFAVHILHNNGIRMEEVQQYLLPESEKTTKEVPSVSSESTDIQSTADPMAYIEEKMRDQLVGEMVERVNSESRENGFGDYHPDASSEQYNPYLDWNENDLMEEERLQRESYRPTAIARTSSFGSSKSSLPYFAAYQPNNVHSLPQPVANSFGTTTNWIYNNPSPSGSITAGPSRIIPPSQVSSTTPIRSTPVKKLELEDEDIILLVDAMKMQDISQIFTLMRKYYEPYKTMKSLVVHIITALKKMPSIDNECTVIQKIYKCLGDDYTFMNDKKMVDMLRLLGFNLLPRLDEEKCYKVASQIIDMFSKDFNAFTSVECFSTYEFLSTKELKYIFIFKIYMRTFRYKDALRLLKQPELKLLDYLFSNTTEKMNDYKTRIVNEFIESSLKHNTMDAKDGIVFFMLNSRVEPSEKMMSYLNILMAKMLNDYARYKEDLINLYDNIINSWYKFMTKTILRSYLINTFYDFPDTKILELFNLFVDLSIYPGHKGTDNSIMLPSNMVSEEIYLIIHNYLYKIIQSKFPVNNLVIKVDEYLPKDEYTPLMNVLTNSEVSHQDMVRRTLMVLNKLRMFPSIERLDIQDGYIILPFHELHQFLQPYRQDKLPPLSKQR